MRPIRIGKRSLLTVALAVLASLALAPAALAQETPPFDECPAIGDNTSCRILIEITAQGLRYYEDTSQATTYEGNATLIGVVNHRPGAAVTSINLSSPTDSIFDFDNDGICDPGTSPQPADCPFGPTLYEGPGVSFSNISANERSGTVNFAGGLDLWRDDLLRARQRAHRARPVRARDPGVEVVHDRRRRRRHRHGIHRGPESERRVSPGWPNHLARVRTRRLRLLRRPRRHPGCRRVRRRPVHVRDVLPGPRRPVHVCRGLHG